MGAQETCGGRARSRRVGISRRVAADDETVGTSPARAPWRESNPRRSPDLCAGGAGDVGGPPKFSRLRRPATNATGPAAPSGPAPRGVPPKSVMHPLGVAIDCGSSRHDATCRRPPYCPRRRGGGQTAHRSVSTGADLRSVTMCRHSGSPSFHTTGRRMADLAPASEDGMLKAITATDFHPQGPWRRDGIAPGPGIP